MNDDRLPELIDGHFQGTLTSAERQELDTLLIESDAARKQLVQAARIHVQLFLTLNRDTVIAADDMRPNPAGSGHGRSRIPFAAPVASLRKLAQEFAWQPLSLVLLAVAMISGAVLIWQLSQTSSRPIAGGVVLPQDDQPRPTVARLTRTAHAKWGRADAGPGGNNLPRRFDGMSLAAGDRLILDAGVAEIAFGSGAMILLQGPAELVVGTEKGGAPEPQRTTLAAVNSAFLAAGKLVALVPPQAHGFTVDTPAARIVDLGTEFGVHVRPSASVPSTEVNVFQGRVTLEQKTAATAQPRSAVSRPVELSAGEAALCEAGAEIRLYTSNATAFVQRMPDVAAAFPAATWPRDSTLKPGDIVAVTSDDLKLVKIDPKTGAQSLLATGKRSSHGDWTSVAISRRGTVLVGASGLSGGKLGVLRIDPRDGAITKVGSGLPLSDEQAASIVGLAEAADGTLVAAIHGSAGNRIVHVDPISGAMSGAVKVDDVQGIQIDRNGRDVLMAGGSSGTIALLHETTLSPWVSDHQNVGIARSIAVGRDGRIYVASDQGGVRRILEVGREPAHALTTVATLPTAGEPGGRWNIAVEADGSLIASPSAHDSRVFRIDAHMGQVRIVSAEGLLGGETFVAVVPQ